MIGFLKGRLAAKQAPMVMVECAGVGYEIETPMSTYLELSEIGSDVLIHTHLLVRDDAHILYGFTTVEEKELFRTVLKVSGVGAKMGLAILSAMTVRDFQRCVQVEDTAMLVKIPGIGKKTAERLIIEMRDKFGKDDIAVSSGVTRIDQQRDNPRSEAIDALVTLGYKPSEVKNLLAKLDIENQSAEDIIRLALRKAAH